MEAEVKARVSEETKQALTRIAARRGEGVKTSDIVREAIGEYLTRQPVQPVKKKKR